MSAPALADLFQEEGVASAAPSHKEEKPFRLVFRVWGPVRGKAKKFNPVTMRGFNDDKTEAYSSIIRVTATEAMDRAGLTMIPAGVPVSLTLTAIYEIPQSYSKAKRMLIAQNRLFPCKTPDADNFMKMMDALNGWVWQDDRQIVRAFLEKRYGERPALVVGVEA